MFNKLDVQNIERLVNAFMRKKSPGLLKGAGNISSSGHNTEFREQRTHWKKAWILL